MIFSFSVFVIGWMDGTAFFQRAGGRCFFSAIGLLVFFFSGFKQERYSLARVAWDFLRDGFWGGEETKLAFLACSNSIIRTARKETCMHAELA